MIIRLIKILKSKQKSVFIFSLFSLGLLLIGSCGICMYKPTHVYVFKGKINVNETTKLIFDNIVFTRSKSIDKSVAYFFTDSNGVFYGKFYREFGCEKEGGDRNDIDRDIQIYIDKPGYKIYHDILTVSEILKFKEILFESTTVIQKDRYHGVWVIPDIELDLK